VRPKLVGWRRWRRRGREELETEFESDQLELAIDPWRREEEEGRSSSWILSWTTTAEKVPV